MAKHILASKLRKNDEIHVDGVTVVVRNWPKLKHGFVRVKASADVPNADTLQLEFAPDEKILKI